MPAAARKVSNKLRCYDLEQMCIRDSTETESRETLDEAVQIFLDVLAEAEAHPEKMHEYPLETPVRRLDEVGAARKPVVRYLYDEK